MEMKVVAMLHVERGTDVFCMYFESMEELIHAMTMLNEDDSITNFSVDTF